MRLSVSGEAAGSVGFFVSTSRSEVIFNPSVISASLGNSAAGSERNSRPKRPSNSDERGAELSPRTPPPCAAGCRFFVSITGLVIDPSSIKGCPVTARSLQYYPPFCLPQTPPRHHHGRTHRSPLRARA